MLGHFTIRIYGLVQDVSFRWYARKAAKQFGVVGYVQNAKDGSLIIEVEGVVEALNQFVAWCRRGPDRARVEQLEVNVGELQYFKKFEIRYEDRIDS